MMHEQIDFETELDYGPKTYNELLGEWWISRSNDSAHRYAYRKIANYVKALFPNVQPASIIDYACGAGHILSRLYARFPESHLSGIDGSSKMLHLVRTRLQRLDKDWASRVELIETELPDFALRKGESDLLVFAFPNIVSDPEDEQRYEKNGYCHEEDAAVAEYLSEAREPDPAEETVTDDPETLYDSLLTLKVISRNLRHLLKKGAVCVRVDYANAPREELSKLVQQRLAFEEGSLNIPVNGRRAEQVFLLTDSVYFRSKVIEDVYHQTKDETDREGGYLLSALVAV